MPGGRPTSWKEEFLQTTRDYLVNYEKMGDVVPTVEGLAAELHVGAKTIYNWKKEHEEFDALVSELLSIQGRLLQSKGLRKETDSGITKLLLSANHGKAEKTETDLTTQGDKITGIVIEFVKPKGVDNQ